MKIHVWGINYSPEITGIAPYNTALCEFLQQHGHQVAMISSFCYYPAWRKLPTEEKLVFRTDRMEDVEVYRCWHFVPNVVTPLKRILHELSFVATSFARQLFLSKPDLLVVVSPPLLLGAAAWLLTRFKRAPFVFHIQDLQPDAAAGLGMVKEGVFLKSLRALEKFAYAKAARVSAISAGILKAITKKGVPEEKQIFFPNGVELPTWRLPERGGFRKKHNIGDDAFLVIYSGNLGVKQGLLTLVDAAGKVKNSKFRLVICGDGAQREQLQERAGELGLKNIDFIPLQPESFYREMLIDADVCVIPQQAGAGNVFFPSKLLSTLAFGRPVVTVADEESELARATHEGAFGINVQPNDPEALAAAFDRFSQDAQELERFGKNGAQFVKQFDSNVVLSNFAAELEKLFARRAGKKSELVSCESR